MVIRVLAVGKKHEPWVRDGIERYEGRLRKPFNLRWELVPHSAREGQQARDEESAKLLRRIGPNDTLVLLDERGESVDSVRLAKHFRGFLDRSRPVTLVIGGAYGVSSAVRERAQWVWSLSPLVFPHQLVRLIVTEQVYRAQEIDAGRNYHHV